MTQTFAQWLAELSKEYPVGEPERKSLIGQELCRRRRAQLQNDGPGVGIAFSERSPGICCRVWLVEHPSKYLDWYITAGTLCLPNGTQRTYCFALDGVVEGLNAYVESGRVPPVLKHRQNPP